MLRPRPAIEARLTILPLFRRFISGITAWLNKNVPLRLKSISFCQSLNDSSSMLAFGLSIIVLPPTAFTRISTVPYSFAAQSTTALTSASSSALHGRPIARPPDMFIASMAIARRRSSLSTPMITPPSLAMMSAAARPMPLPTAVISATLSLKRMIVPLSVEPGGLCHDLDRLGLA